MQSRLSTPIWSALLNNVFMYMHSVVGFDLEEINPASMRKFHPSTLRWYLFHNYFKVLLYTVLFVYLAWFLVY